MRLEAVDNKPIVINQQKKQGPGISILIGGNSFFFFFYIHLTPHSPSGMAGGVGIVENVGHT